MNVTITINGNRINNNESHIDEHECANCGQVTSEGRMIQDVDGDMVWWCDECIDGYSESCDRCECDCERTREVCTSDAYWLSSRTYRDWCPSCIERHAVTCECCGEPFARDAISRYEVYGSWCNDDQYLCEECHEDNYYTCNDCGCTVHVDEACYCERDDCYYCPDCYTNHQSDNLLCYGHTYGETFWTDNGEGHSRYSDEADGKLFLGIELETDNNDSADGLADDIMDEFYEDQFVCKEDGSLHHNGVEIVSQPMTPNWHLNSGWWDRITELVRRNGGSSHDAGTCGLHIHMSRDFFGGYEASEDAGYRMDRLLHRFQSEFINFSRRTDFHYCAFESHDDLLEMADFKDRKRCWHDKKWDRYQVLNMTNHPTIELRLWRGTLNMETIKATIEMTAGLAILCKTMSDELAESLTWQMLKLLVRYALESNNISHTELDSYLDRRGL